MASDALHKKSHDMVSGIPSGQPILVGHHSEKRHRNTLYRSWNTLGKAVEASEKADYYLQKAQAAENNKFDGGAVVVNKEENRLQIFFNDGQ